MTSDAAKKRRYLQYTVETKVLKKKTSHQQSRHS